MRRRLSYYEALPVYSSEAMEMTQKTPAEYVAFLIRFQAWRRDDGDMEMPDPTEIGEALDWAIKALSKVGKRKWMEGAKVS